MQVRISYTLHVGISGPGALLELQPAPFGIELITTRIEPLEIHEQLARAMLAVDCAGCRCQYRAPQERRHNPEHPARYHAHQIPAPSSRSATRSSALRERTLSATSAAP